MPESLQLNELGPVVHEKTSETTVETRRELGNAGLLLVEDVEDENRYNRPETD